MTSTEQIRRSIGAKAIDILTIALDYYLENGVWIPERALHKKGGGIKEVRKELKGVGGSAIYLSDDTDKRIRRYVLTILGMLLTRQGSRMEDLLADFVSFARKRALEDPELAYITSEETQAEMELSSDEMSLLGTLLEYGYMFRGGGSRSDEAWKYEFIKQIELVPEDTLPYVQEEVGDVFDSERPVDPNQRESSPERTKPKHGLTRSYLVDEPEPVLISQEIVQGTRGYLNRVLEQVNGCYSEGHYDACAVMLRRLIESLILECYEAYGIDSTIKDHRGEFLSLKEMIADFLSQDAWNIGRDTRRHLEKLPKIKGVGDLSAHNRRFNATRNDIDRIADSARVTIQELASIAFEKEKDHLG